MKSILCRTLLASLAIGAVAADTSYTQQQQQLLQPLKVISPETVERLPSNVYGSSIPKYQPIPTTPETVYAPTSSPTPPVGKLSIHIPTGVIQLPSRNNLILMGCILAANNGFMNGLALGGVLKATKQAVSAVTGAWTTSAMAAAKMDHSLLQTQISVILSYMGGSSLNGILNPNGIENALPLLVAGLLVAAAHSLELEPLLTWILLALATGITNSWTSQLAAGNLLRSAHFSGITSDMGTFMGQILRGNFANAEKLRVFAMVAASFWIGGWLSVPAANHWGADALQISIAVYAVIFGRLIMG
jgi:hypothetical protein